MAWISPTLPYPIPVEGGHMRNISNRTLGYLPKETFSQRGRLGTEGPVSQITLASRRELLQAGSDSP